MKRGNAMFKAIKNFSSMLGLLVLAILVYKTSYSLVNSLSNNFKIDKTTSNYLSFNYVDDENSIYEVNNPRELSDFKGKRLLNDYYDFEVAVPEDSVSSDSVEYQIIIKDLGNNIDNKFIKVYLTNQNNDSMKGFESSIPVYTAFTDYVDGKVIYTGRFTKDDLIDKYRLRIWVSNTYKGKVNQKLAFQIKVEIK